MPWLLLLNGTLWAVTLAISVWLAWQVSRRPGLPARLFLGMVALLAAPQLHSLVGTLAILLAWLFSPARTERVADSVASLWPLDIAAVVLFACLTLHLFLLFPTESRLIRAWRWSPLLFYLPGGFLAAMLFTHLAWGSEAYVAFWGLDRLGLRADGLQLLFILLTTGVALVRLLTIYLSHSTPLLRQQLAWILGGLTFGGGMILLTDYLPSLLGRPPPIIFFPGLRQLPVLIILGTFALSMQRHRFLDVAVIVNRSVVYSALMAATTLLYLILATVLSSLLRSLSPGMKLPTIAILTTLLTVLVALPLRDALQRGVDRLFYRRRVSYRRLLQDYSRVLTTLMSPPRLLSRMADQVEEVFHPSGLAIVLTENGEGYRVVLSRGRLAAAEPWREGTHLASDHLVPAHLLTRRRPFYLPWHLYDVPEERRGEWKVLQASDACLFVPMSLGGNLVGWLALGPQGSELVYTRADLEFLSALADQSCVALENARLYSAMQQRATELAVVATVSAAISCSLDQERVLQTIVESVIQVIGCDKSAIFELSEDGSELRLRTAKGLSPDFVRHSQHLRVGQDSRAQAVVTGQPLIVPDVYLAPDLADLARLARQEGYRAVVDMPLWGREGLLGVLSAYFAGVHTPSVGEMELLTTIANHASIALENARLYAAVARERDRARRLYEQTDATLARRLEELTSIEEISRQLTGTLDLQQVMDLVLERALQATSAARGVIALCEQDRTSLHLLAQRGYPPEVDRYRTEPWPADRGITGRVARTGLLALVPDVGHNSDYVAVSPTSRSQLSVPIRHQPQIIGVITLESDRPAAFTTEHVRFIQLLADHAAIGIRNAQLFQQVIEGRDRLQAILNSTHDAVIVFDTEGQVILINPRVRELFGPEIESWLWTLNVLDVEAVVSNPILQISDLNLDHLAQTINRVQEQPTMVVNLSFSFQMDGQRRYVEGTASPVLSATGEVLGRIAMLRDVTHQQELEQFRQDLTSMMIHNLQGPLAALISSLEMLQEEEWMDPAMTRELLRIALDGGRNLYTRIESVLWIRRLEDRNIPINLQEVSLSQVILPVMDEYRPMATAMGLNLEANLAADLPPALIDAEVIGRVFTNLLDNAFKYTPPGGRITIQAVRAGDPAGSGILCSVADTGQGIAESARETIFDKFRRGDGTQESRRKGMGIGLHFCKLAIEAHGGRIWVESQKGRGSTFYFTLPVARGVKGKE